MLWDGLVGVSFVMVFAVLGGAGLKVFLRASPTVLMRIKWSVGMVLLKLNKSILVLGGKFILLGSER